MGSIPILATSVHFFCHFSTYSHDLRLLKRPPPAQTTSVYSNDLRQLGGFPPHILGRRFAQPKVEASLPQAWQFTSSYLVVAESLSRIEHSPNKGKAMGSIPILATSVHFFLPFFNVLTRPPPAQTTPACSNDLRLLKRPPPARRFSTTHPWKEVRTDQSRSKSSSSMVVYVVISRRRRVAQSDRAFS